MLPSAESLQGQPVPEVTFRTRFDNQWRELTTDELFKGKTVVVFSRPGCPFWARAKAALSERQLRYTDISQNRKINTSVLRAVSGRMAWPQVFIGGHLIGGADELDAHLAGA